MESKYKLTEKETPFVSNTRKQEIKNGGQSNMLNSAYSSIRRIYSK